MHSAWCRLHQTVVTCHHCLLSFCAFYIFISHIEWLKGMEQRNLPNNHDNSVELDADNVEHPHANLERCNGVDTHRPAFVIPSASSYAAAQSAAAAVSSGEYP